MSRTQRPGPGQVVIAQSASVFAWGGWKREGWIVTGHFRQKAGEWIIYDLRLHPVGFNPDDPGPWPKTPGRGVNGALLRRVPISRIKSAIADHMLWFSAQIDEGLVDPIAAAVLKPDAGAIRASRQTSPTSPRVPDELLEQVALAWLKRVGSGEPGSGWEWMAGEFDRSVPTIKRWLHRARVEGWLAPHRDKAHGAGQLVAAAGPKLLAAGYKPLSKSIEEAP